MPLAPILDITDDVEPYFGISCCDSSKASRLLQMIVRWTESQARQWVGHGISQNTYENEYHRRDYIGTNRDHSGYYFQNGLVHDLHSGGAVDGHVLRLDNAFVRSILEVRVDGSGNFGSTPGSFGPNTALSPSTDYSLEFDSAGMCKSGHLLRISSDWPYSPGSIRVDYVSGFSQQELNSDYSFIKESLLHEMRGKFNSAWSQQGSSASSGIKSKEIYHGDYTVEYAVSKESKMSSLSDSTKEALNSIRMISL